jgi:hypothetical protein
LIVTLYVEFANVIVKGVTLNGGAVDVGVTPICVPPTATAMPSGFDATEYVQFAAFVTTDEHADVNDEPVAVAVGVGVGVGVAVTTGTGEE